MARAMPILAVKVFGFRQHARFWREESLVLTLGKISEISSAVHYHTTTFRFYFPKSENFEVSFPNQTPGAAVMLLMSMLSTTDIMRRLFM